MVLDARDKEITLGDHVRYVDTGTIGEVIDTRTKEGIDWVKIEKTNLWYRSKLVELLDEKDLKRIPVGNLAVKVNGNGAVMVTEMLNKETGEKGYFVVNAVDPQYRFKADVTLGFNGVKTLKVLREGKTETLLSENEKFNFVLEEGRAVFVIPQK